MSELTSRIEALSYDTFEKLRHLIYEKTNIAMRDGKQILVSNRLRKRILELKLGGYDEYYRYLTNDERAADELPHFIDAVSTNETYFYREPNHLEVLKGRIFPDLFSRKRKAVLWSAGCSTGEEAYTLRILFEENRGKGWDGELRIVATDINTEVVEHALAGIYRGRTLRFLPEDIRARYFNPDGLDGYAASDALRGSVEFRVHNLIKEPPPVERADVIFCRNVMIYFDKPTQRRLVDDYFAPVLDPQGYFCIGHSESLSGTSRAFRFVRGLKAPVYRPAEEEVRK